MEIIIMFITLILTISEASADDCQNKVASFLSQPNYDNYLLLNKNDLSENSDVCWPDIKKDVNHLARLYNHARQGNIWAIKILVKHTRDLDGGELEDAYIALGESIDKEPRILLRELKEHRMTKNQFMQALLMLPLSLTDNEKGELSALESRKRKILSVKDTKLKHEKELAVKALNIEIKRIIEELP